MNSIYDFLRSPALDASAALTILEIGCATGADTLDLRRLFPRARIFCFEPDPRNVFHLKKSILKDQVTLIDAAVGDHDGEAVFNLSDGKVPSQARADVRTWTFSSSLKKPTGHLTEAPWVKFERTAKVKVIRLDTFIAQHGVDRIDFIWADVQGAEDLLIAGGQQALARTRYFYTECYEKPLYEGQIGLDEMRQRLPGGPSAWEVVHRFPTDVLLRNTALA